MGHCQCGARGPSPEPARYLDRVFKSIESCHAPPRTPTCRSSKLKYFSLKNCIMGKTDRTPRTGHLDKQYTTVLPLTPKRSDTVPRKAYAGTVLSRSTNAQKKNLQLHNVCSHCLPPPLTPNVLMRAPRKTEHVLSQEAANSEQDSATKKYLYYLHTRVLTIPPKSPHPSVKSYLQCRLPRLPPSCGCPTYARPLSLFA